MEYNVMNNRPVIMGILNVTPDSFSDGGKFNNMEAAIRHANEMVSQGATIIDVGGESTRPGFTPISAEEELSRVIPVVKELKQSLPKNILISVDTMKGVVAQEVLSNGADIINDVAGLMDDEMVEAAKASPTAYVLMHGYDAHIGKEERPKSLEEVGPWTIRGLEQLLERLGDMPRERIWIDPGFGFGKKQYENGALLDALPEIKKYFGLPLFIGVSRKHFVKLLAGTEDVVEASVQVAKKAYEKGGDIFRVHDVFETCKALNDCV